MTHLKSATNEVDYNETKTGKKTTFNAKGFSALMRQDNEQMTAALDVALIMCVSAICSLSNKKTKKPSLFSKFLRPIRCSTNEFFTGVNSTFVPHGHDKTELCYAATAIYLRLLRLVAGAPSQGLFNGNLLDREGTA